MTDVSRTDLDASDYRNALTEVSFLLDILAATVDDLMGGATVSLGRVAGRNQARRLPIFIESPTLTSVVEALRHHQHLGAQFSLLPDSETIEFGHCAIRAVCAQRGQPLGGNLCRVYHYYLDGIINEFLLRPTRSHLDSTGDSCRVHVEVR